MAQVGCRVAGMDIDTAAIIALAKSKHPVSPKSRAELSAIVERTHDLGLKFMLKGVLSVEDALAAEECGCDAIVVSNHGGRAFEALPGTAAALSATARSVKKMTVLVDGGVRSGADVLKMLALGAKAVLIGHPAIIAGMDGEEEGVQMLLSCKAPSVSAKPNWSHQHA
ncbi:alpha-hydroxy-acid oxidizing protein [uncultured Desulfovibrio sp.]|uniref:alpha-hydroxy-acid oxidizing protein n=1 Tax=uncultured Desulfovibrio sp. TaxID=167968 RepID=UPI00260E1E28|nr:alpha-hydroxy-acid oxidizing protein [uncultured Desulfovibrio sp.]